MEDVFLPVGRNPICKVKGQHPCAYCGDIVDKQYNMIQRSLEKGWNVFCSMECKRAYQTKYKNMSALERRHMYESVSKANRRLRKV